MILIFRFNITSWQIQSYFIWFNISLTLSRHSYCIHGCNYIYHVLTKEYNVQILLYRSLKCLFIVFATTTSVDSHIFQRLYANKNILSLNKAIPMRFSQNKAWYPVLNTYSTHWGKIISHLFLIFYFQRGPFFLTHPVREIIYGSYERNRASKGRSFNWF